MPLFLGVTGIGLYLAVTQPDRDIARLKSEIRKAGLDIAERGQQRQNYPDLEKFGKDIAAFEKTPFSRMTSAEKAQYVRDTDAIFQQVRAGAYGAPRPELFVVDMYSSRVARLCSQRASFHAKSDPEEALEALSALSALAEHLARLGSTLSWTQYATAYAGLVASWIDQPSWLDRLGEVKAPKVDPMEVLRITVDQVTLAFQDVKMEYSYSPKELWSNFRSFSDWKRQEREYYEQVLGTLASGRVQDSAGLGRQRQQGHIQLAAPRR